MRTMYAGQQIVVPGRSLFDQASPTTLYVGEAVSGSHINDNAWLIYRITFDANGNPTEKAVANKGERAIWSDRATLEYS